MNCYSPSATHRSLGLGRARPSGSRHMPNGETTRHQLLLGDVLNSSLSLCRFLVGSLVAYRCFVDLGSALLVPILVALCLLSVSGVGALALASVSCYTVPDLFLVFLSSLPAGSFLFPASCFTGVAPARSGRVGDFLPCCYFPPFYLFCSCFCFCFRCWLLGPAFTAVPYFVSLLLVHPR